MAKSISDMIKQGHVEVRQRLLILKGIISGMADIGVMDLKNDVLGYMLSDLLLHFGYEELMIGMIRKKINLPRKHSDYIEEVLGEHKEFRKSFMSLDDSLNVISSNDEKERKDFVLESEDIITRLEAHARKEDDTLFPLAEEVLEEKDQLELEHRMAGYADEFRITVRRKSP